MAYQYKKTVTPEITRRALAIQAGKINPGNQCSPICAFLSLKGEYKKSEIMIAFNPFGRENAKIKKQETK